MSYMNTSCKTVNATNPAEGESAERLFIKQHLNDDIRKLALTKAPAGVDMMVALTQIEGYQIARHKLPTWAAVDGIRWPRKLSLEQCSSEATARYKNSIAKRLMERLSAAECKNSRMADITGGLGIDFSAMAPLFAKATYVEQQTELCELARNNFACIGLDNWDVICDDANSFLNSNNTPALSAFTLLFIDPARRDTAGRKVARIEDCQPDVCQMQDELARLTRFCIIKLSPMLDITAALRAMKNVKEVYVVDYQGECKELLLVIDYKSETNDEPTICCTDLSSNSCFSFTRSEEENTRATMAENIGKYLYEPSSSLLKAGAFNLISSRYGLHKLAPMSHLYTSDMLIDEFQGRKWKVEDSCTFAKQDLRRMLSGIDRAELSVRGFPMTVAQLRKQLRLKEGGNVHLMATTVKDRRVVVKISSL